MREALNNILTRWGILNKDKTPATERRHFRRAPFAPLLTVIALAASMMITGCEREPELHLHRDNHIVIDLPIVDLQLDVYWNYYIDIDWMALWYYGWEDFDAKDSALFLPIGYTMPEVFNIRRYYLGKDPKAPHTTVLKNQVTGNSFTASYEYYYYDFLVWNEVLTLDGAQFLTIDEQTTLEYVTASTSETSSAALSRSTKYPRAFNQPENLFSAYKEEIYISDKPEDYDYYDPVKRVYHKYVDMKLVPDTYIYFIQLILRNNRGRIDDVLGSADLSGMARSCNLNTGIAGDDDITVHYNCKFRKNRNRKGEMVDVIGGKCITFGICNINANTIKDRSEVTDDRPHYLGIPVLFSNGMDSTLVFPVSDQIRDHYKGGIITVELNMDTVPIPTRPGGSAFNAVVADWEDGGTHVFDMATEPDAANGTNSPIGPKEGNKPKKRK